MVVWYMPAHKTFMPITSHIYHSVNSSNSRQSCYLSYNSSEAIKENIDRSLSSWCKQIFWKRSKQVVKMAIMSAKSNPNIISISHSNKIFNVLIKTMPNQTYPMCIVMLMQFWNWKMITKTHATEIRTLKSHTKSNLHKLHWWTNIVNLVDSILRRIRSDDKIDECE